MSPLDWAKLPLFKYSDFAGRASRPEYWWYTLANVILIVIASTIDSVFGLNTLLFGIYGPLTALSALSLLSPSLAVASRRLHDTGRSGWWILLAFIPLAGLVLIYFLALEGATGPNEYGARPEANPSPIPNL